MQALKNGLRALIPLLLLVYNSLDLSLFSLTDCLIPLLHQVREQFHKFDADSDGHITSEELVQVRITDSLVMIIIMVMVIGNAL